MKGFYVGGFGRGHIYIYIRVFVKGFFRGFGGTRRTA